MVNNNHFTRGLNFAIIISPREKFEKFPVAKFSDKKEENNPEKGEYLTLFLLIRENKSTRLQLHYFQRFRM